MSYIDLYGDAGVIRKFSHLFGGFYVGHQKIMLERVKFPILCYAKRAPNNLIVDRRKASITGQGGSYLTEFLLAKGLRSCTGKCL
jgi:hypothetical protein